MNLIKKVGHRMVTFYRRTVIREQYPLLTWLSRKELHNQGALGVVYMLHHIAPKDLNRIPTNEDLKVSPVFLEKIILNYKKKHIDIISLDEVFERLTTENNNKRPFVSFTIDDGYVDNFTNALPVFEKYQIPFAIFVATDFIDQKAILWWDSLEDLILSNDSITTSDGRRYLCSSFQQRWDTFRYLRQRILKLNPKHLHDELQAMFINYKIDWLAPIKKEAMTWEQIRILASHPLCTIGGHTVTHSALNNMSKDDAKCDVKEGMNRITKETGIPVHYFSYPYGILNDMEDRDNSIIHELNIKMAFLDHQGCITNNNKCNFSCLPRFFLHQSTII